MKKDKKPKKVKKVMEEFKEGELHSGSKKGPNSLAKIITESIVPTIDSAVPLPPSFLQY